MARQMVGIIVIDRARDAMKPLKPNSELYLANGMMSVA